MYLPALIFETITIKQSMCKHKGILKFIIRHLYPCKNEEGNYDVKTLSKTLLKRGSQTLTPLMSYDPKFWSDFTLYVTNSREYNYRIPQTCSKWYCFVWFRWYYWWSSSMISFRILKFCLYLLPLSAILRYHNIGYHVYADDTQLDVSLKCKQPLEAI